MRFNWTNKEDNVDTILAEDVNNLASGIIEVGDSITTIRGEIGDIEANLGGFDSRIITMEADLLSNSSDIAKVADNVTTLQSNTDEIKKALYGEDFEVEFSISKTIPTPYFEGTHQYYRDVLTINTPDIGIHLNGEPIDFFWNPLDKEISCNGSTAVIFNYYPDTKECDLSFINNISSFKNKITSQVWQVGLYLYDNFSFNRIADDNSPSGFRYEINSYDVSFLSEISDKNNRYAIICKNQSINNLIGSDNIVSAVNKNTRGIVELNNRILALQNKNKELTERISILEDKSYKTYGVSIDLANSNPETAVTYTDTAVGMVAGSSDWDNTNIFRDIRPCLFQDGEIKGYLNPNDFTKYVDGTSADISTGAEGDVMIEIPKVGVKIATSDNTLTVQVTDNPNAEGFSYLAHTREKHGDKDKLYIGAFLGYNLSSKLRSLCSKQPTANITIGQARTLAQANGDGYDQIAFYQLTLLQCLFLIKYKSRNSQTALGRGYVTSNSSAIQTGSTVAKGMDFGETTGKQQIKFLGIEDFWGNLFCWIDGLVSSSNYHALTATKNFNDDGTGYNDKGQVATTNIGGYMKIPQGTNDLGFIIKIQGGSSTTYFADGASFNNGFIPCFGSSWNSSLSAGAFNLFVDMYASDFDNTCGGRLMYL